MPDRALCRGRHRRAHTSTPAWWVCPASRARAARLLGLPLAVALCLLAVVLVLAPAAVMW